MSFLFKKINLEKLPKHVAFIMDGNRRWAQKKGKERNYGHHAGSVTFEKMIKYCQDIKIKYITFYAFSTENWKRSEEEIRGLFDLLRKYMSDGRTNEFLKSNIKVNILGDISKFPKDLIKLCADIAKDTKNCTDVTLNLALNYGSRDEILYAAEQCVKNKQEITKENFEKHLYTAGQPDPDLIIRTSGEYRLSNFLLYQAAYSELYFVKTLWPAFSVRNFKKALIAYQSKSRRFGGR